MALTSWAFGLRAGAHGESELSVRRFLGTEALSEPYALEVDFFPVSGEPLDLEALLGEAACLTVRRSDGEERAFHGIVSAARHLRMVAGRPTYRATLSPEAALRGATVRSRTFLGETVPGIVKQVLGEAGIAARWAVGGTYPRRECTAQYREADLAFAMRLLEQEGIAFWLEQKESGCEMAIADGPRAFAQAERAIPFRREEAAAADAERITELASRTRRVPKAVALRDYDFERPPLDLTAKATGDYGEDEVYEEPGGYVAPAEGERLAKVRLEELRFGAETWAGKARSMQLAAGRVFEVTEHPAAEWNQKLLAVRVTHAGGQQRGVGSLEAVAGWYETSFLAIPAERPYRPRRRTPRPVIGGFQRATVVGPAGEEIHTDAHGRVRLAYHWNAGPGVEAPRSGWVRVIQALAGPGFGALYLPRVGQEVLVSYEGGDPDRPLVVGAVFNGAHPPPVDLPKDKTQSTLTSRTSPQPDSQIVGYNELRLEDAAGREEIRIHAQRDEAIEVREVKDQRVSGSETLTVKKDRSLEVSGNQSLTVEKDDRSTVEWNETSSVTGDRSTETGGDHVETVGAVQTITVEGEQTVQVGRTVDVRVGAGAALTVGGAYLVNVGAEHNTAVAGARLEEVGGLKAELVGLHREERVAGEKDLTVKGDASEHVSGSLTREVDRDDAEEAERIELTVEELAQLAAKSVQIEAEVFTVVVAGEVRLRMEKSGDVQVLGKTLRVDGRTIQLKGQKIRKIAPRAAQQQSAQAALAEELLTAPAVARLSVQDLDGNPVPNEPFSAELPDGATRRGRTDANGRAALPSSRAGVVQVRFDRWEESKGPAPRGRNAAARSGATRVEAGGRYAVKTGGERTFELPVRNAVTVMLLVGSAEQVDPDYPRFVLESSDGAYRQEMSARDDLVEGDEYLQLRFEGLLAERRYTLRQQLDAERSVVVFEDVAYSDVLDCNLTASAAAKGQALAVPGGRAGEEITIEAAEGEA